MEENQMSLQRTLLSGLLCGLLFATSAFADQLEKGDTEINFAFTFQQQDIDDSDLDPELTSLSGSFGYLLTDAHELGAILGYTDLKIENESTDLFSFGAFYHYNFRAAENLNPYVGAQIATVTGDDAVSDSSYGLTAGVKMYPWENGGFNFGVSYDQFAGDGDNPDSNTINVFAGVLIKF
jgi:hypothetical protein